jgi:hypothetical protein
MSDVSYEIVCDLQKKILLTFANPSSSSFDDGSGVGATVMAKPKYDWSNKIWSHSFHHI